MDELKEQLKDIVKQYHDVGYREGKLEIQNKYLQKLINVKEKVLYQCDNPLITQERIIGMLDAMAIIEREFGNIEGEFGNEE